MINYNVLNDIYHFQEIEEGDLYVGNTYLFVEWTGPAYIGTILREERFGYIIRIEKYLPNDRPDIIRKIKKEGRGERGYYKEGDEVKKTDFYQGDEFRKYEIVRLIPNYVRPERRAIPTPAPEPIKTIEVEEGFLFNDIISGDGISKDQCEKENNGYTFVFQTPNGSYIGECLSPASLVGINRIRGSLIENCFRIEFAGASYDVQKPNWMNQNYTANDESKGKTFFLEPNGDNTYKLVKLNIRIKTPNQEVEEPIQEEREVINNSEKRSRKNGGKRRKRNKNKKTKKRRYRR